MVTVTADAAPMSPPAKLATSPSVAIVHDYLTQRGGAERVVLAMHHAFPDAAIYTSLYDPRGTYPEFASADVRTLLTNAVAPLRRHHRLALLFLAPAFGSRRVDADVVLCSSSGWAHGVRSTGRKIVYCHTPARWLYQTDRYLEGTNPIVRAAFRLLKPMLVAWDVRAARTADRYVTQSSQVRARIRELYNVEAELLPAPYAVNPQHQTDPVHGLDPGFFLCVSRLVPYKNVAAIARAFARMPSKRLVVAGEGRDWNRLMAGAPSNVRFLGAVTDAQLAWLYANSRALVSASHEDYGLTPLEAATFGKPSIVLRWGGFLDTVVENETGLFFDSPDSHAIEMAVKSFDGQFSADRIRRQSEGFTEQRFVMRLRDMVGEEAARV